MPTLTSLTYPPANFTLVSVGLARPGLTPALLSQIPAPTSLRLPVTNLTLATEKSLRESAHVPDSRPSTRYSTPCNISGLGLKPNPHQQRGVVQ